MLPESFKWFLGAVLGVGHTQISVQVGRNKKCIAVLQDLAILCKSKL